LIAKPGSGDAVSRSTDEPVDAEREADRVGRDMNNMRSGMAPGCV